MKILDRLNTVLCDGYSILILFKRGELRIILEQDVSYLRNAGILKVPWIHIASGIAFFSS